MGTTFADLGLFTGISQSENFADLKNLIPVREMTPATNPRPWPLGDSIELPEHFETHDSRLEVNEVLARTATSALLVLRDGAIRYENYWNTGGRDVQWISMSVAKSFVSALVGALVDEGTIRSIDDPITDYITVPAGSAYDGVKIRDILLMSSGARWNEDYSDQTSDAHRLKQAMAGTHYDLDDFVRSMERELEPGTLCRYNSADTQVLGLLIREASGGSVAEYMRRKLVEPLGFEHSSYWLIDTSGNEAAFGGLNLTARDFARLGELYRLGGNWHGVQVIGNEWVRDSTRVTASHCLFDDPRMPRTGYGYQWWLPGGDTGVFSGIGVYNQFVYVDPSTRTTIVKLSANPTYGLSDREDDNMTGVNLALLETIAKMEF